MALLRSKIQGCPAVAFGSVRVCSFLKQKGLQYLPNHELPLGVVAFRQSCPVHLPTKGQHLEAMSNNANVSALSSPMQV